jgi:hypothetical protein
MRSAGVVPPPAEPPTTSTSRWNVLHSGGASGPEFETATHTVAGRTMSELSFPSRIEISDGLSLLVGS